VASVVNARTIDDLARWFRASARDLPWRGPIGSPRDAWAVLVSETMLQQTQVSRIAERFPLFMRRFPTPAALAAAEEREVLALWAGLGYYRRARNLHAAARLIVERFGGAVPRTVEELLALPGVGRYTAGAVASIAFGDAAPIVDGNIARVLLRVHGRESSADDRAARAWLWDEAARIAAAGARGVGAGVVNEAVMELGATVCLPAPAAPRCDACPLASACAARRAGTQARIPPPKGRAARQTVHCASAVLLDSAGRIVLERRGGTGMWAGLWQAPTVERADRAPTRAELARAVGLAARDLHARGTFTHATTHRLVRFDVYRGAAPRGWPRGARAGGSDRARVRPDELDAYGLSSAQRRVLRLALGGALSGRRERAAAAPVAKAATCARL
jgi:A/G-specific adenine glycosylase